MDRESALAARFASAARRARTHKLTVDATLRQVTLSPGGWRLYGSAVQVSYQVRAATTSTGTLATGETAPVLGALIASTAGGAAGFALGAAGDITAADSNGSVTGSLQLTTDPTAYDEIQVPAGTYMNVYLAAGSAATPTLVGPYE